MKIWLISGWLHLAVGFAAGWLFVKRPQWVTDLFEKIKANLKFWS